jgi:ubiquinone/menaquinone biosynthesis C-methylase UbiE
MDNIQFTGERFSISKEKNWELYFQHMGRYLFTRQLAHGKFVLDAACGTGYGTAILAQSAYRAIGIDISKETVSYCNQHNQKDNTHFVNMDCTNLAFPKESFDLVVSFETLEHLKKIKRFVKELHRVLKPNGQLIISTPNRDIYALYNKNRKNEYHTCEFDENGFRELMEPHFKIEKIYGQRFFAKKDIPLLAPYTSNEIPTGKDGILRKLVRVGMRSYLPDGPLRSKLISYEIWANKCRVGDIAPSKAVYMIGTMRKKS